MKFKKIVIGAVLLTVGILLLGGCSGSGTLQMVNECRLSLDDISNVTIAYDEEKITFFESSGDELVVKEYMTANKSSYYAKVVQLEDNIHISEGHKPFLKDGFNRYIEVYLPKSFRESLKVCSTNGDVDFSNLAIEVSSLRIDCTSGGIILNNAAALDIYLSSASGTMDLGKIQADQIRLETTNGNVTCDTLIGNVTYVSTSGTIDVKTAIGSGRYRANNSGKVSVVYTAVKGDLSFFNKNGSITLMLPVDLAFRFNATTKNGSVSTNFQQDITVNGRTTSGIVGDTPTVTVKVETNNGNIEVKQ